METHRSTFWGFVLVLALTAIATCFINFRQVWWGPIAKTEVPEEKPEPTPQPIECRGIDFSEVRSGKLDFPVKIVFTLCNAGHENVYLQSPDWIIRMGMAQLQVDASGHVGFKFNAGEVESLDATVQPGQIFRLWIGLSSNYDFGKLYERRRSKTLGVLVLTCHIIGGPKFEQRFVF